MASSIFPTPSSGIGNFLAGNTASRPSSPSNGTTYFNTTFNTWEVYSGSIWRSVINSKKYWDGGTEFISGDYSYNLFTAASSTFITAIPFTVDILMIAGGGGGGTDNGGGGGAGGLLYNSGVTLTDATYTMSIGTGGAANTNGGNTTFSKNGTLVYTAVGGGTQNTLGGSGGGGTRNVSGGAATSGQGNAGGNGSGQSTGGGGGAGAAGTTAPSTNVGGAGGNGSSAYSAWGLATSTGENVSGTVYYAGGGGGIGGDNPRSYAAGLGGGGAGATGSGASTGSAATANTGGGGGGGSGSQGVGGAGGSGIVIIRYAV